jgi:hypothetical protein
MKSIVNRTKRAMSEEQLENPVSTFTMAKPIPRTHTVTFALPIKMRKGSKAPLPDWRMPNNSPENDDLTSRFNK